MTLCSHLSLPVFRLNTLISFAFNEWYLGSVLSLICPSLKLSQLSHISQTEHIQTSSLINGINFLGMIPEGTRNLDNAKNNQ